MSFLGSKEDAKKYCAEADIQIDGNSPASTSPVMNGGSAEGAAPMTGEHMFTKSRTRYPQKGNTGAMRREFPAEGVSKR